MIEKTKKQKRLETLRDAVKSGQASSAKFSRTFIEDTDGTSIALSSAEALPAIERRLAALEGES